MAKKKKRKSTGKKDAAYSVEIKGIMLILIAIIGCCPFGVVADIIRGFAGFLVGVWYTPLLLLVGAVGVYMMVKRQLPDFLTSRLIGFYILTLGILILSHTGYIASLSKHGIEGFEIITETVNNLMGFVNGANELQGGGMIGAIFAVLFVMALTLQGTRVVCFALIICGLIMFTGVSIYDAFKWSQEKLAKAKEASAARNEAKREERRRRLIEENAEEDEEEDNKIVVSSIDDLTNPKPEENNEEEPEDVLPNKGYKLPATTLLSRPKKVNNKANEEAIKQNVKDIEQVLRDFNIEGKVVAANIGPSVTQYELEIKSGTKVSKITGIHREMALELGAKEVRIQAPIPGKKTVGIELPNKVTAPVVVREILESIPEDKKDNKLLVTLGKDIMGKPRFCEIDKTPHMLVAGSTGSGKSVCINSMLISILMRAKPNEVRLVLVDPKKVELNLMK